MFVVVNADDLGLHPAVRRAVEALAGSGVLSSSSLLANGPDLEAAARVQGVGLGAHLNILRGRPLGPPAEVSSLVGPDGLFLGGYAKLLARYVLGRVDMGQVEREWSRQIQRLVDLGVRPTHCDSEKHVHAWPGLMSAACRTAKRFGIKWVRRPRERSPLLRLDLGGIRAKFLSACALFQRPAAGVGWPDLVWGVADQGRALLPGAFRRYIERHRPGLIEVVCHPGLAQPGDPPLPPEFGPMRVSGQWADEYGLLSNPAWTGVLRDLGAELTNYGRLGRENSKAQG
ncbi:MAG: ChbG/HpnK family deacetylase [Desulfovibrionaceae bacterium]|nr:ChbG/HpnK family deacetylase [Desulfovibrionaceae bacterium]